MLRRLPAEEAGREKNKSAATEGNGSSEEETEEDEGGEWSSEASDD